MSSSPQLFAGYHVLHRLIVPRHPPYALINLIFCVQFIFPLVRSKSFDSAILQRKIFMFVLISSFQRSTFEKSLDLSKLNRNLSALMSTVRRRFLHRKEVIHPHVPVGIPCYDLTPIISPTLGASLLAVTITTSGIANSHGLTGGVYKPRERIHRDMLIHDY